MKADQRGRGDWGAMCPGTEQNHLTLCENSLSLPGLWSYSSDGSMKKKKMNPLPCTHALTKQGFSQLFFLLLLLLSVILCPSSAHLQHLFTAVPIWRGHPFKRVYLSSSPLFAFVKVHCVRSLLGVYLGSFPPPLLQRLSSIITALDSSSDGKCFSIPCSPSLPLNLHLSLSRSKQITSWLL